MKKIAIIGAGWKGLGCLKVLKSKGYQLDVFEELDDVGGTWHPSNNYAGLKIHTSARTIEYADFPLPSNVDRSARIHSSQIYQYLKDYCRHNGFYPHIRFNASVKKIKYDSRTRSSLLTVETEGIQEDFGPYDYVIYSIRYTHRNIPSFAGRDKFKGEILHSFEVKESMLLDLILANRKVALIGGSKSASDFILKFHDYGYKVAWIYRASYWFMNLNFHRKAPPPGGFLSRLTSTLSSFIAPFVMERAPLLYYWGARLTRKIHTYDRRHADFKRFHVGVLDRHQIGILRHYALNNAIVGDIEALSSDGIVLKNGRKVECDSIICCTGSGCSTFGMDLEIDHRPFDPNGVRRIYRYRVMPEVPNLIFSTFGLSSGTVAGLTEGNWAAQFIEMGLSEPELAKDAETLESSFFDKSPLFDSSDYIIRAAYRRAKPFFMHGELSFPYFYRWTHDFLNSSDTPEPLEFKKPGNKG
jgi:hypothetical protein